MTHDQTSLGVRDMKSIMFHSGGDSLCTGVPRGVFTVYLPDEMYDNISQSRFGMCASSHVMIVHRDTKMRLGLLD